MHKIFNLLLVASACIVSLSSCSKKSQSKTSVSIVTADSSGTVYSIGNDLARLWNEEISNMNAHALASKGGLENLSLVSQNDDIIGFANTSIAYESYMGTGNFVDKKNDKLRVIAGLYYNPNQIVVNNEKDINKLEDLVGKTFSPGNAGSTSITEAMTHFDAVDIDMEEDLDIINASFSNSVTLMKNGTLDGAWIIAGVPNNAVSTITKDSNFKLISLNDSTIAVLQSLYPWYAKYIIPAGTYENQTEDIQTTAVKLALVASEDLDENIVYKLTKTFWENIDTIKKQNPALNSVCVEITTTDLATLPIHKGAAKYYKEIGIMK